MGAGESNSEAWTMRCDGASAVHEVTIFAQDFAAGQGLSPIVAARLAIVIEELVTNVVEHGMVAADGPVDLAMSVETCGVRIIFVDPGLSFDPRLAPVATPDPEGRGGGAGIDLIKAWTEIVDYRTADGLNRLELLLPLDGGAEPEQ